jgi:hypothetical protein
MTTVQREPGTIIRDRYVLTAVAEAADAEGGADAAPVWRAVDMVLRRPVIVVFDPPAPTADDETRGEGEGDAGPEGAAAGALGRIDPEPPTGVPVGEILDGGNHLGEFYRVFRTPGDTSPIDPTPFASTGDADPDVTVVAPLFGAIDGADATRPMGLPAPGAWPRPPLPAGFDQPVDPTIELPTPGALPWAAALAPAEPAPTGATTPAGADLPPPSGPMVHSPYPAPPPPPPPAPPGPRRAGPHPVPLSVAAASVLCVLSVGGYLLTRQPSSVATTIGPPPAAAQAAPRETVPTTVEETTTTETLPETTTTVETTTWARPTTTRPPVTEPPETEPPTTAPTTAPTTTRWWTTTTTIATPPGRKTTTTGAGQFEVNTVGDDPFDLATAQ